MSYLHQQDASDSLIQILERAENLSFVTVSDRTLKPF